MWGRPEGDEFGGEGRSGLEVGAEGQGALGLAVLAGTPWLSQVERSVMPRVSRAITAGLARGGPEIAAVEIGHGSSAAGPRAAVTKFFSWR